MQTAIFVPPSHCGCRLRITAEFSETFDGVSYRHPRPFSIKYGWFRSRLEIVRVCADHELHARKMPDTSRFYDKLWFEDGGPNAGPRWHPCHVPPPENCLPMKNGKVEQHRGYLHYPIKRPTPAECLYTHLSMHRGQVHSYPCGCASFMHFDAENHAQVQKPIATYLRHPVFSRQCNMHQGDTLDMKEATAFFKWQRSVYFTIEQSHSQTVLPDGFSYDLQSTSEWGCVRDTTHADIVPAGVVPEVWRA